MYKYWKLIDKVMDSTLALEPESRVPFLEKKFTGRPEILEEAKDYLSFIERAEMEDFLQSEFLSKSVLADEISSKINDIKPISHIIGRRIGVYEIKNLLGEGGMGSVYLADRVDGEFSQQVAIKFIRSGFYSLHLRERFNREKQLLSKLYHPHIAHLLDGGITDDGSPYLIMEYIAGDPIDIYCRKQNLRLEDRLSLFLQICQAVQFAHSKLIIHRDLKPDNIFVTRQAQIKIMDFGIGKSLQPELDETHIDFTRNGHIIASFDFAAPEQLNNDDVYIQTDVYGLGGLLYLLVTDERLFNIKKKSIGEIEKIICEQSPVRPGLRSKPEIGRIPGDLEAIILKALRKEPDNRYESVVHLMDDMDRLEQGLPVLASQGKLQYRAGKFIKRNKTPITAIVLFSFITAFFSFYHVRELTEERDFARAEAERAQAVTNFLSGIFENASPFNQPNSEITAREVLDIGTDYLYSEFSAQPDIKMSLLTTVGSIYTVLDDYDKAGAALADAYELIEENENQQFDIAFLHQNLGNLKKARGDFSEAAGYHQKAASLFRELNLPDYEARNLSLWGWDAWRLSEYDKADSLYRLALDISMKEHGVQSPGTAEILHAYGWLYHFKGENTIADSLFTEVLNFRRDYYQNDHPELASILHSLGWTKYHSGEFASAEALYEEAIAMRRRLFQDRAHSDIAWSLNNLGVVKMEQGLLDEAEQLFLEALDMRREVLPANHPEISRSLGNLGSIYYYREQYDQSISVFKEVLDTNIMIFGEDHTNIAMYSNNLAAVLQKTGNPEQSIPYLQRALEIQKNHFKTSQFLTLKIRTNLAGAYDDLGAYEKAEHLLLENYEALRDEKGDGDAETLEHLRALVDFYTKWNQNQKEEQYRNILTDHSNI